MEHFELFDKLIGMCVGLYTNLDFIARTVFVSRCFLITITPYLGEFFLMLPSQCDGSFKCIASHVTRSSILEGSGINYVYILINNRAAMNSILNLQKLGSMSSIGERACSVTGRSAVRILAEDEFFLSDSQSIFSSLALDGTTQLA